MQNGSTWNLRRWDIRSSEDDAPSAPGPKQAVSCMLSLRTPRTRNESRIGGRRGANAMCAALEQGWGFRSRPALGDVRGCSLGAELLIRGPALGALIGFGLRFRGRPLGRPLRRLRLKS